MIEMIKSKISKKELITIVLLIIISISITLCNFIFINHQGYLRTDTSVWINIAKKINEGKIIYKDIFEHKGPVLYFLYYLGYKVADQFGIWILDFIFNLITVSMIYLTSKLIVNDRKKIFIILSICLLLVEKLCYENPCTESIALSFTLIAMYFIIKYFIYNSLKIKEIIIISINFAIVLLLRPNLVILWVLFYMYILIKLNKEKRFKEFLTIALYSALGVSIIFIPVIIYMISNNCMSDFIYNYILLNIQYAGSSKTSIIYITYLFISKTYYIIPVIAAIYIGLIIIKTKLEINDKRLLIFSCVYFFIAFYLVIMPQRFYEHYLISMIPTVIVPLAILLKQIKSKKIVIVSLILFCYLAVLENVYVQAIKINYFNEIDKYIEKIQKDIGTFNKQDDLLVLGNNTYIYLILDINYDGKYFYQLPIANQSEKIANEAIKDIEEQLPTFIIDTMNVKNKQDNKLTSFEKQIKELLEEHYYLKNGYVYINKEVQY